MVIKAKFIVIFLVFLCSSCNYKSIILKYVPKGFEDIPFQVVVTDGRSETLRDGTIMANMNIDLATLLHEWGHVEALYRGKGILADPPEGFPESQDVSIPLSKPMLAAEEWAQCTGLVTTGRINIDSTHPGCTLEQLHFAQQYYGIIK